MATTSFVREVSVNKQQTLRKSDKKSLLARVAAQLGGLGERLLDAQLDVVQHRCVPLLKKPEKRRRGAMVGMADAMVDSKSSCRSHSSQRGRTLLAFNARLSLFVSCSVAHSRARLVAQDGTVVLLAPAGLGGVLVPSVAGTLRAQTRGADPLAPR